MYTNYETHFSDSLFSVRFLFLPNFYINATISAHGSLSKSVTNKGDANDQT